MKKGTLKTIAALVAVTVIGVAPVYAGSIANVLSLSVSGSNSTSVSNPSVSYKTGDVNRDGVVNLTDTLIIVGNAIGIDKVEYTFDDEQKALADYDGDKVVTLSDALSSLKEAIGVDE